jgi:hypothetical protein
MDWSNEDRLQRERLERQSSNGQRLHVAGVLNAIAAIHTAKEAPDGFVALNAIRKRQRLAGRSSSAHNAADERFAKVAMDNFNRLFPRNKLASAAPVAADRIGPDDARDQRFTPDLAEARRLLDAAGRLASDPLTTRDHWAGGQPEAIAAEWLLTAARALVAAERERQTQEAAHDMASGRIPLSGRR